MYIICYGSGFEQRFMKSFVAVLIHIKHRYGFLWNIAESVNGALFRILYPSFSKKGRKVLDAVRMPDFRFSLMEESDIPGIIALANSQPGSYLAHFDPHAFDRKTFSRLLRNGGYLLMQVKDAEGRHAGYFFLRGFCVGKAFMGLLVGREYSGRGIGTEMWRIGAEICREMKLPMFATVSQLNLSSLSSARKATEVTVKKHLDNGYLLIRCDVK